MTDNIQEKIENKIIDCITLGAGGRLVVFKPVPAGRQAENLDIDLVVEKKGDYKQDVIYLKIFNKEFAIPNLETGENSYSVFVNFDIVRQELSEDLFIVSPTGSKNAINKKDFAGFLIGKFNKK